MKAVKQILCALSLSALAVFASAEVVRDLYETRSLVSAQTPAARAEAAQESLLEVLVKVSGQRDVSENPLVQAALKKTQNYILQFSYESTAERLELEDGQTQAATALLLKFSPQAIEGLLRSASLPLWPANRPSVLVWLVTDELNQGRNLVSDPEIYAQVMTAATERGLPVVKPLFDLQDRIVLDPDGLWSMDQDMISNGSQRYDADAILLGRYTEFSNGRWRADWNLLHKGDSVMFQADGDSNQAILQQGIDQAADRFATLFAIVPSNVQAGRVFAEVAGVDAFSAYIKVLDYFSNLDMVRDAQVEQVHGDKLLFSLDVEGGQSLLLDTIALDKVLQSGSDNQQLRLPGNRYIPRGIEENPLQFSWATP